MKHWRAARARERRRARSYEPQRASAEVAETATPSDERGLSLASTRVVAFLDAVARRS
jgi:hypothetical protein